MPDPADSPGREANRPVPPPLAEVWRWRRVFRGHQRELSALRRWLSSLLPDCPARDDVLSVATELGSNAVAHTASGRDGWFAVEVTWHPQAVLLVVADCGGPGEPQVIDDPDGERGRGLRMVEALSARTGFTGDTRGRLVWAQVPWTGQSPPVPEASQDPHQAAVREGEAALAHRFARVPAWSGRSTLAWWAAGPRGLVSAPTAQELAGLLYRLLDDPGLPRSPASRLAPDEAPDQYAPGLQGQRARAGDRRSDPSPRRSPGTGSAAHPGSRADRSAGPALVPALARLGATR